MTIQELINRLQKFDPTGEIRVYSKKWYITDCFEIFLTHDSYEENWYEHESKDIILELDVID